MEQLNEILQKLKIRNNEARKNYGINKMEESKNQFTECVKIARENNLENDAITFDASVLIIEKQFDEAISKLNAVIDSTKLHLRGLALDRLGLAYQNKNEYDKAIECYEKALAEESYDAPGDTWNNMGVAYHDKKEYDKAIECYEKALAEESYDAPGNTWFNLGLTYQYKNEYDKAIECYEKALAEESYDTPGKAWNNLGLAYYDKKEYDKAIECYEKVLAEESYDTPWNPWNNLGLAYQYKNEYDKAIECYEKTLGYKIIKDDIPEFERIKRLISISKQKLRNPEIILSSSDQIFTKSIQAFAEEKYIQDSPESRILNKILKARGDIATRYIEKPLSNYNNVLIVLKGWSSATPFFGSNIENLSTECRGGGYFIKWKGKGIIIDPGIDFVKNFDEAGFNFQEVDLVIVSHNHTDHNQDLRLIDDIMYELKMRKENIHYYLLTDEDTRNSIKFDPIESSHRKILPKFDIERVTIGTEKEIDLQKVANIPIIISYFKVEHEGVKNAVGFKLNLYDNEMKEKLCSIGMTCDTMYFEDLCHKDNLRDCDLLIAHISQPDDEELTDSTHLKKGHLGYRGSIKLIQQCEAKLYLVTEFWGGKGDLRIELIHGLRESCKNKIIFPGSIGFKIDLNKLHVECTNCNHFIIPEDIIVSPPVFSFGKLQYLCPNCRA